MAYFDPNQLQSFQQGQTPDNLENFQEFGNLQDAFNLSKMSAYSPYASGYRGEGMDFVQQQNIDRAQQQVDQSGFDPNAQYARGSTDVGHNLNAQSLYQLYGDTYKPIRSDLQYHAGHYGQQALKTAGVLGALLLSGGTALGGAAGAAGGATAGGGISASGAGAATGSGLGATAGTGTTLAASTGTGAGLSATAGQGLTLAGSGAAGSGAAYTAGDYARQGYNAYNTAKSANSTYQGIKNGDALGAAQGIAGLYSGYNSMANYNPSTPSTSSVYEREQPMDYSLGSTGFGGGDYSMPTNDYSITSGSNYLGSPQGGGLNSADYSFGNDTGANYDLGSFTSPSIGNYGQLSYNPSNFAVDVGQGVTGGGEESLLDQVKKRFMQTGQQKLGTAQGLLGTARAGVGLYNAYQQSKQANKLAGQAGQQISSLQNMFGPNSPYAQQLQQQLARKDAAAGRRSQYGPREVQLQAALAEQNARLAPSLGSLYQQQATLQNQAGAYRNALGNVGLGVASDVASPFVNRGIKYLGGLFE